MNENELVEVESNYSPGYEDYDDYWGSFTWAGVGQITFVAEGELRNMILTRTGAAPESEIKIVEDHVDIGYCPSCTRETQHIIVYVNGEEVWRRSYAYLSPFAEMQSWLLEEDEDD